VAEAIANNVDINKKTDVEFNYGEKHAEAISLLDEEDKLALKEQRMIEISNLPIFVTRNDVLHYLASFRVPKAAFQKADKKLSPEDSLDLNCIIPKYHPGSGSFQGKFFIKFNDAEDARKLVREYERVKNQMNQQAKEKSKEADKFAQAVPMVYANVLNYSWNKYLLQRKWKLRDVNDFTRCLTIHTPPKMELSIADVKTGFKKYDVDRVIFLEDYNYIVQFANEEEVYRALRDFHFGKLFKVTNTPVMFKKFI
jgi:hypothetical protein